MKAVTEVDKSNKKVKKKPLKNPQNLTKPAYFIIALTVALINAQKGLHHPHATNHRGVESPAYQILS